jgi:DNA helicase-2/ATP-dependent DNA helicase PcrA
VTLMTMHSAKGLEFPQVYVVGMEDGLFPGNRAMGEPEEMEEERRLCYVAMTRAKEKLTMTNARQRTLYGRTTPAAASRFLNEIPEANREWLSKPEPRPAPARWDDWSDEGSTVSYVPVQQSASMPRKPMAEAGGVRKSSANSAPLMKLQPGESVSHDAFGKGMVLSVRPMGNDALIEVAFDKVGTKKLMLKAAGSHLKKMS